MKNASFSGAVSRRGFIQLTAVALVTGAGGFFGRMIAIGLARAGASVFLTDKDAPNLAITADLVRDEGGRCESLAGDGSEENILLTFRDIKDFEPEQVARQIPQLKAMLAMRSLLRDACQRPLAASAIGGRCWNCQAPPARPRSAKPSTAWHVNTTPTVAAATNAWPRSSAPATRRYRNNSF